MADDELRPIDAQRAAWSRYREGLPFAGHLDSTRQPLSRHDVRPPLAGFPPHGEPWHYEVDSLRAVVGKLVSQLLDNQERIAQEYLQLSLEDPLGRGVLVTRWRSRPTELGFELSADVPQGEIAGVEHD